MEGSIVHDRPLSPYARMILELVERHGVSVVIIHHHNKSREHGQGALQNIRGSSVLTDYPDTLIRMVRDEEEDGKATLYYTLRNAGEPSPQTVTMAPSALWFEPERAGHAEWTTAGDFYLTD